MRAPLCSLLLLLGSLVPGAFAQDGDEPAASPRPPAGAAPQLVDAQFEYRELVLEFDQPMVTWATRGASTVLRLTPDPGCQWYWHDDTRVACVPPVQEGKYEDADAFGLAQPYRLAIGPGLVAQNGVALAPLTRDLVANPPKPTVKAIGWNSGQPTLVLVSNQALDESSLRQRLHATFADTPIALRLEPVDADTLATLYGYEHAWFLRFDDLPTTPGVLQVDLDPGLRAQGGPAPGPGGGLWAQPINAPFLLTDARCDIERGADGNTRPGELLTCAAESDVLLYFSRPLDPAAVAAWAQQLPAGLALAENPDDCGYRCTGADPGRQAAIRLTPRDAGRRYRIDAGRPLRAADGAVPAHAVAVDLQVRDFDPGLYFDPQVQVLLPGAADQAKASGRNLPALQWAQATIGSGRTTLEIRTLPAGTPRNQIVPLGVPGLDAQIGRRGGLLLSGLAVTPELASLSPTYEAQATAVAAFNLIAVPEPGRILLWASDWASADGLPGVDVELIALARDGSERVLGRVRTGADGSGWLPHDPLGKQTGPYGEPPATYLLLRARHRGRSTVLPLENTESQEGIGVDGVEPTTEWSGASGIRWGATSRLLYRPGDHVDWRLWLRERHGLALQRPQQDALELELRATSADYGMGRVHEEWRATLDEWGSVTGRMRLPETLEDGVYCIAEKQADRRWDERVSGACFQVARFDAPSLWATLTTPDVVRLRGESVPLAGSAGFFSGGPAANAGAELRGTARAAGFSEAWPALARWDFLDDEAAYGVTAEPLAGLTPPTKLDGEGGYAYALPLPQALRGTDLAGDERTLAFAQLHFNLAVNDGGKAQAFSPPASLYYAGHERYVGLRTAGSWLTMDADPLVEAVVATHAGVLLPDIDVQLRIETTDANPRVLAQCKLRSGKEQRCPFRAPDAGVYVLVAEAGDAAPVRIRRWFGDQPQPTATPTEEPEVSLAIVAPPGAGTPARLRLRQPHAAARALVLVEHEGVLAHWLQDVGPDSEIIVPVQPQWHPGVSVRVLVRPRAASAADGFALPTRMVATRLDLPRAATDAVGLELAADELAPGAEAVLILHNPHDQPRLVTLAIVDDAVHQQASAVRPLLDPAGARVLGRLAHWRVGAWRGLENWRRMRNPLFRHITATPIEVDAAAADGDVPLAPPAPPPPPAAPGEPRYDSLALDKIEVTGSRVVADANVGEGRPVDFATREPLAVLPTGMSGPPAERVRSRFPEAAYWEPGLVLAPGERREVRVRLPDNLTRWRVLAWVSDRGGDFELHEATLQTSLAVELRTGLPAMLYPGDAGEGIVSARLNENGSRHLSLQATATGAGVQATTGGDGDVAAHDLLARSLALAPTATGRIDVLAHASDGTRSDALSAAVPVRSRQARLAIAQTGWLDRGEIVLGRPPLPEGASEPTLSVLVSPGLQAWRREWIVGLREYPHRCWEQILSRGIGAAFALRDVQSAADWPEAQQLIDDAWRVAAQYRDANGRYVYFTGSSAGLYREPDTNLALSAYTLRGFAALTALGQPAPAHLRDPLQALLRGQLLQVSIDSIADDAWALDTHAAIAGALADAGALTGDDAAAPTAPLQGLWQHWDHLSWYGRSELVRALAAMPALQVESQQGLARLRGAGVQRGASRRLDDPRDFTRLMGSSLRDQCALVTTLATLDTSAPGVVARGEFLRGLQDLYAGGNASLDSQANAQCLLALRAAGIDLDGTQEPVSAQLRVDGRATALAAASASAATSDDVAAAAGAAAGTVRWTGPLPDGELVLAATPSPDLSYLAEVGYAIDLRDVRASGTGMQLERRYAVLRGGRWVALGEDGARVGDWLRVTLQLTVPRDRHFVAITDVVPGGWASRDVSLAGVAGEDVRLLAEPGSTWFATRQTGAGEVKLYAERLPAGVHAVHWYAQATHAGTYFAAPALAELMYGRASRATTDPATVPVAPAR